MNRDRVQPSTRPVRSPGVAAVTVLAVTLLTVTIVLADAAVEPIDPVSNPGPLDSGVRSTQASWLLPSTSPSTREPQTALGDAVPGFAGTVHLWVEDSRGSALLIWPDHQAEPMRVELPARTRMVDLSLERVRVAVATINRDGRGVLWVGDGGGVEPVAIFDHPISLRWSSTDTAILAVSVGGPDRTDVIIHRIAPGNVLVEQDRFRLEAGRAVDWIGSSGVSLASLDGRPVATWLTYDGRATTYSRHLTQPGGRPIFDICTGVPCRPTVRMFASPDRTFTEIPPEVVQVTGDARRQLAVTATGPEVRFDEGGQAIGVPMSGLNGWSSDSRWMVFEQQGRLMVQSHENGQVNTVVHPLGFLDTETRDLFVVSGPSIGDVRGIWLP